MVLLTSLSRSNWYRQANDRLRRKKDEVYYALSCDGFRGIEVESDGDFARKCGASVNIGFAEAEDATTASGKDKVLTRTR